MVKPPPAERTNKGHVAPRETRAAHKLKRHRGQPMTANLMDEGAAMGEAAEEKKRRKNERRRQRYAEDSEFRERKQAINLNVRRRKRYATDPDFA